jgi:thiamine biosynthesis lipoprotein
MITRRRFFALSAAVLAAPGYAATRHDWQGVALGAEARLTLAGATDVQARHVFARVASELTQVEAQFSLYRDSSLTRLNRDGRLLHPAPDMLGLFVLADQVHQATGGAFDPTIQPLWLAVATGGDLTAARAAIGWGRLRVSPDEIKLNPGMALTFNGIAQGHAADRIAALMHAEGFGNVLINMGEVQALGTCPDGGPWRAQIAGPGGDALADLDLQDRALATSSPLGTRIGSGAGHILHPKGLPPRWQTVSISAPLAAVADALSTAACLMDRPAIDAALAVFSGARLEHLS